MERGAAYAMAFSVLVACSSGGSDGTGGNDAEATSAATSTTDGSSDGTDATDGSSDGESGSFVNEETGGGATECDVWAPECGPDEKCGVAWGDGPVPDAYVCTDPGGDAASGEACTVLDPQSGLDTCGEDSVCFPLDDQDWSGYCVSLCGGDPNAPSCADDGLCTYNETWKLCAWRCLPVGETGGCPDADPRFTCVQHTPYLAFSCVVASAQGQAGTPCLNDTECAFGFGCRDANELSGCDGQRCCTPYCLTGSDCEDGMICSPFFEGPNVPPEVSEVGICVVP